MSHYAILPKIKMMDIVPFFSSTMKGLSQKKGLYSLSFIFGEINYLSSQRQGFSLLESYFLCLWWALIIQLISISQPLAGPWQNIWVAQNPTACSAELGYTWQPDTHRTVGRISEIMSIYSSVTAQIAYNSSFSFHFHPTNSWPF